ncbi:MAG: hypothetical protein ACTSUE_13510 [Promethearchaeota archaeon]
MEPETATTPKNSSKLINWPIQLAQIDPKDEVFHDSDLIIIADCVGFAHPTIHDDFIKNRVVAIFCPKLDKDHDRYIEKLECIFNQGIRSLTVMYTNVPCCKGINTIINEAKYRAKVKLDIREFMVNERGETAERDPRMKFFNF